MAAISKQTSWEIQKSVVFALFLRELNARFGRFTLGYLWALLEPLFFVLVLSFVRGHFTGAPIAGLPPAVFFASGVIPFILFRNIVISAIAAVDANQGLFNYQRVKSADVFAARLLVESLSIAAVSLLIFPTLRLLKQEFAYNSVLQVLAVLVLLLMFTTGIGLIFTVLGPLWIEAKKVLPLALRPLFFISGLFFPISSIPPGVRAYFLWNPLLHGLELLRGAAFVGYRSTEASWTYLFWCSTLTFAVGLAVYRLYRIRIVSSGSSR
ncbi:MAG: kpsM [Rariglobus sp.]|jgi:capsular polysaccharide transport system permease protein|nr:kpsM [Rariglobus sp.]